MSYITGGLVVPATVQTGNIQDSLRYFARINKILHKDIDFFIVKVLTQVVDVALPSSEATVFESEGEIALDEQYMNNASYQIKQNYTINIFVKEEDENNFKFSFEPNSDFSLVKVVLQKGSNLVKNRFLERIFYAELIKILALNNVILYHFDENLRSQVFAFLRDAKNGIQEQDVTFIAAKASGYEQPVADEIEYVFKTNKNLTTMIRTSSDDLYDQNYIKEAKSGDILIEYKKPIDGKAGRNCKGIYLEALKASRLNEPKFLHDTNSIEKREYANGIIYISKKEGFVNLYKNTLTIDDNINVRKISAKETGTIRSKEAKDATLNVLEDNPIVDAIGSSMTVNVAKLRVNGSVANDAKLHAKEVEILGVTHATSYVSATNFVKIKNHRGFVESPNIEIGHLEGGTVNGEDVKVATAHHGTIRARNVFIKRLCSNCIIMASESITIEHIEGEENDIYISPSATLHNQIKIQEQKQIVHTLGIEVKKIQEAVDHLTDIININKANVSKIAASKSAIMPDIHKIIVQRFKDSLLKLKKMQEELIAKKASRKYYADELENELGSVFRARIKIKEAFSNKQTIRFQSVNGQDYYYVFKEMPITLRLVQSPDGKYKIIPG